MTRSATSQRAWVILLIAYPFSFYFFLVYSESLYLLLTLLLLISVHLKAHTRSGLITGLLTATRPTGVIAIPYLVVERIWRARSVFLPGKDVLNRARNLTDTFFPIMLMPIGIACYMAYLYWLTGDALAFSHVQVAWGRGVSNPIKNVYWALSKFDWYRLLDPEAVQSDSFAAAFAILAGLACMWLLVRRLFFEAWLLGATVALALTAGMISLPRFVSANPVFLLVVGDIADRIRSRILCIGLVMISFALQAILLFGWFIGFYQLL